MSTEAKALTIEDLYESLCVAPSDAEGWRQHPVPVLDREVPQAQANDILLCHGNADAAWVTRLAERIQVELVEDRNLDVDHRNWDSPKTADAVEEIVRYFCTCRVLCVVVSKPMSKTDWSALERIIAASSQFGWFRGRVLAILLDNTTMPAFLRLGDWLDFRDKKKFEESFRELVTTIREHCPPSRQDSPMPPAALLESPDQIARVTTKSHSGTSRVRERLISNLYPVVELPKQVFSAETHCRTESEVTESCAGAGPLPFILREGRLYTLQPLYPNSALGPALRNEFTPAQEDFAMWFSEPEHSCWGIDLLNISLCQHAWKRGLRFDESQRQYYFPRSKPKRIWWQVGGSTIPREVTTPNIEWKQLDDGRNAEVQYGWRHQSVHASFVQIISDVFLHLEPTWLLTELDGKTPMFCHPVKPILSHSRNHEGSGQILRSLKFWSIVLAKGHSELRISTGQNPIRAKLTPASGFNDFGIRGDQVDYDQLMLTDVEDDLSVPALGPLEEESAINYEEDVPSYRPGSRESVQGQARI
jgi:TIR domain-containing protein